MTKQYLLHDTNLSEINFSEHGRDLELSFINMYDGRDEAKIDCCGLLVVNYHNTCSYLPLYVGELVYEDINGEEVIILLDKLGYGFANQDRVIVGCGTKGLYYVHLEGGEIEISIVCTEVKFNRY